MGVAAETVEETVHLLVHHRMTGYAKVEVLLLRRRRQFAVEQQIACFEEVTVLGKLLDGIAAVKQHALIAIDIGDLRFTACCGGEAGVVSKLSRMLIQRCDVDDAGADRAILNRQFDRLVVDRQRARLHAHG